MTKAQTMAELSSDMQTIYKRLDTLEREIRQLREVLRPQVSVVQGMQSGKHPYVESDSAILDGEPCIKDTRTPVRAIVEHWKFGDAPEDIARKLPHLRLAQIFDALGYYDDHRDEIERYIALNRVPVDD
jgi:uncharacterized protein (DUF433 family)